MPLHAASGRKLAEETGEVISGKTIDIRLSQNLGLFLRKKIQKWSGDLTFALSRNKHKFAQISSTCTICRRGQRASGHNFATVMLPILRRTELLYGSGQASRLLRSATWPAFVLANSITSIIMIYLVLKIYLRAQIGGSSNLLSISSSGSN